VEGVAMGGEIEVQDGGSAGSACKSWWGLTSYGDGDSRDLFLI
jgi:hypothetical protein